MLRISNSLNAKHEMDERKKLHKILYSPYNAFPLSAWKEGV